MELRQTAAITVKGDITLRQKSVSILIPTLNCARTLQACLASIAAQNYPPELVEIIVADGGSTDGTLDVARGYTDRIVPNPLKTGEAGKQTVRHLMDFE